jgi:hypothetical protein
MRLALRELTGAPQRQHYRLENPPRFRKSKRAAGRYFR